MTNSDAELVQLFEPAPATPSQFLPGTAIQYAWDSTCLSDLKKCPRYYEYVHIQGWQPKEESIHLRFGIEYHQALHDYEIGRAQDASHDDALRVAVRDLLVRCQDYPNPDPGSKPSVKVKTKLNLLRSVIWYLDEFGKKDPCTTVQLRDETPAMPAMEVSFKFELDWGPRATFRQAKGNPDVPLGYDQPYLLCGHLDRLVTFNDEVFVMDRKTATTTLSPYYFQQYEPNNQMTLYTLAGQVVLGTSIRGVIIDAISVQVGGSWPQRGFTYRTQGQLDEWLKDLRYWLRQAESYATDQYWPMNDTACDKFGGCRFRDICNKDPRVRQQFLRADFHQKPENERWNPLRSR